METFVVQNTGNVILTEYIAGAVIALLILIYLVYSLVKPEKF
jgi:K+-transporting ATPase KdpF subunit